MTRTDVDRKLVHLRAPRWFAVSRQRPLRPNIPPGRPGDPHLRGYASRLHHLSCYGYRGGKTPSIDALASGGTLFSQADSQIPITLPSHLSLFTSTYPFANGLEENGETVPPGAVTLAEVLRSHGYSTAAFIGGYFLARGFGLNQGFSVYESPFPTAPKAWEPPPPATPRGGCTRRRAPVAGREWQAVRNLFAFVHLFDLHHPYTEPESFRARYPASEYDAELAYADSMLGDFWQFLKSQGLFSQQLTCSFRITAKVWDHGESTHGYFIYQRPARSAHHSLAGRRTASPRAHQ